MWRDEVLPSQECCVDYKIFFPTRKSEEELTFLAQTMKEYVYATYVKDYIWQDESFDLTVSTTSNIPFVGGSTRFGDNIEDEWFIVFLLFEISKKFQEVFISVEDDDGQFLLIETALHLPKWLGKSENALNRVWISKGELHIIPKARNLSEENILPPGKEFTLVKALNVLRNFSESLSVAPSPISSAIVPITATPPPKSTKIPTVADAPIQSAIQTRIQRSAYISAHESTHYALCYVPNVIYFLLKKRPELVAKAVTSYYHRDPIQVRV